MYSGQLSPQKKKPEKRLGFSGPEIRDRGESIL